MQVTEFWAVASNIFSIIRGFFPSHTKICSSSHAPSRKHKKRMTFVHHSQTVGPHQVTCFMSPFWHTEFGVAPTFLKIYGPLDIRFHDSDWRLLSSEMWLQTSKCCYLLPWRWSHKFPPKHWLRSNRLHNNASQKKVRVFPSASVTKMYLFYASSTQLIILYLLECEN